MMQTLKEDHRVDAQLNPAGGTTTGTGIQIQWQDGPLGRDCCNRPDGQGTHAPGCDGISKRKQPNGAFVEGVIAAAIGRLQFYQSGKFACRENALAITKLEEALHWCNHRTHDREFRSVEGTHSL